MVCVRGVPGQLEPSRRPTAILTQPKRVGDRTTTLRRLLIGAVQFCWLYMYILYIRQKFRTSLSKKIGVNTCFEDGQKVVMITVKVNSKSELHVVENREGKSMLYGVICCCDDRLLSRAVICGHTI